MLKPNKRELEVAALMKQGFVLNAIARKLFIGIKTIYAHRSNIRNTIGARNAFEILHMILKESDNIVPILRFSPHGKDVFTLMLLMF